MDIVVILKHGHQVIVDAVAGLSEAEWNTEGVCGIWSTKDIVGHLASVEHFQEELLRTLLGQQIATPYLERAGKLGLEGFNTRETEVRRYTPCQEVWDEYTGAFESLIRIVSQFPDDLLHKPESGSFYVEGYDLADWFVHGIYGHKREHAAQIVRFRESVLAHS